VRATNDSVNASVNASFKTGPASPTRFKLVPRCADVALKVRRCALVGDDPLTVVPRGRIV
jgi:hypothetical protein